MTVLLIWYFAIIVPLLVMIYYGDKGRAAFENFMSNDVGTKGEELIKRFQNWNQ